VKHAATKRRVESCEADQLDDQRVGDVAIRNTEEAAAFYASLFQNGLVDARAIDDKVRES
jgi:hypothetical protein